MNEATLYFEVDNLSVDKQGNPAPAGLALSGLDLDTVQHMTPEMTVLFVAEITGFEPERIHPISRERYVEEYEHKYNNERTTNND